MDLVTNVNMIDTDVDNSSNSESAFESANGEMDVSQKLPAAAAQSLKVARPEECRYCIDQMCDEMLIPGGESLCKDPTVQSFVQSALFKPLDVSTFIEFRTKIMQEPSARKVAIVTEFGSALTVYLQTQDVQQNARKKMALTRFIGRLYEIVEKEKKHACAGDQCSEPVDASNFVTFDDVAGAQNEKREIFTAFINPMRYSSLFPTLSKGVLFYGPPGTGKTLIAKATANYIGGAAFYAPTPSDFKGGLIGETEAKVRNVFECACQRVAEDMIVDDQGKTRPRYNQAIIFIDEFEAIATDRESKNAGTTSSALTVPTLLQLMEGVQSDRLGRVSIMAATNLPWTLDPAILRRIPAKVFVDLPNRAAREFVVRKALNEAFSKFLNQSEYEALDNKDDGMYKGMYEKDFPYLKANFKVTAKFPKQSGGIYLKMLGLANEFSIPDFIGEIAELTGPTPSALQYRRLPQNATPDEYSERTYEGFEYGYSLSDLDKAMDAIVADAGNEALKGSQVVNWETYEETLRNANNKRVIDEEDFSIPEFIKSKYLFCVSKRLQTFLPQNSATVDIQKLTPEQKQRVVSWELNLQNILGANIGATPTAATNGILRQRGSSVDQSKYRDVVNYYRTGKGPNGETE